VTEPDPIEPLAEEPAIVARPGSFVRWLVAGLFAVAAVVIALGPGATAVWETVHANLDAWQTWTDRHLLAALVIFFVAYAVCASLPMPVLTIMSLLAGCLFGRWLGTGVASLAYTAGVTIAFLAARGLLREPLRRRFGDRLRRIERGFERDGAFYLLALRLMPGLPFFLVTWLMALTPIRTRTFTAVSWVGVLPLTFLYAVVGTELAAMQTPADVLSLPLLVSLAALAVLPLLMRKLLRLLPWRSQAPS
jgi:uncharacterized membrane protein YdjX (TVP38/TMEM64 family)